MKKKNRLELVAFSLNGFLFLLGGVVLIDENKIVLGIIQLVSSLLNILMIVRIRNKKRVEKLNHAILVMNVIVCISVGIDYMLANKTYIQYAWFFAAVVSLVALIIQIRKKKTLSSNRIKK